MLSTTESSFSINAIDRLKAMLGIETDSELAERLGVKQNTVSGWRSRDSLDYRRIIEFCDRNAFSLDLVFRGHIFAESVWQPRSATHIDKEESGSHISHTHLASEYVIPAMIELTPGGDGFSLTTYGTGAVALKREYVIQQWGFDPSVLRTVRISSNALQRRFRVGEEVLVDPLFDLNSDARYLDFRYALDVIVEEGYYLLASKRRPFWRQVAIADQPDTLIALSHEPDVPPILLSAENREHYFVIYHIIAGEPPLYALPGRRRNGNG